VTEANCDKCVTSDDSILAKANCDKCVTSDDSILAKPSSITLANRRLVRERELSDLRREAGSKGLAKRYNKTLANTVSASASIYSGNGEGGEIPTLAQCRDYATSPVCAFPPELVEEWFNKASDRGWGRDWRARMRGAVATYRAMHDERRQRRQGGKSSSPNI
jgi:hypothetical protein